MQVQEIETKIVRIESKEYFQNLLRAVRNENKRGSNNSPDVRVNEMEELVLLNDERSKEMAKYLALLVESTDPFLSP